MPIAPPGRRDEISRASAKHAPKPYLVPRHLPGSSTNAATLLVVTALTVMAVGIHGYHPYAEDAGLYVTGVKKLLNASLYPYWSGFVTAQLRFSFFAPIIADLVRVSHLGVMTVMFAIYCMTTWLTLFGAWLIAGQCYWRREARYCAVSLLALWLTMPIAGTSLLLVDPYVSARSISTPFSLIAIAAALDVRRRVFGGGPDLWRSLTVCLLSLLAGFAVHPLMSGYTLECVVLLTCLSLPGRSDRIAATAGACCAAFLFAICLVRLSSAESADYVRVAQTRTYWFLSSWHWYELLGLIAPLLLLELMRVPALRLRNNAASALAHTALAAGVTGFAIAILSTGESPLSLVVARLQPLRVFQCIYILMILAVGATLGERVLKHHPIRWFAMFSALGSVMVFVQVETFPNSAHIELPWAAPLNDWERGFVWIREHTPTDSIVAMDANYITDKGEDAQSFRAIAERSAIPDYAKDGGVASIAPDLTEQWIAGEELQSGLDGATDAQRIEKLRGSFARWIVLAQSAQTDFACPYSNKSMKVCRIPEK
jgi:hypothetical protein